MKKVVSILLSVLLIIAMLPMEAFAVALPTDSWESYKNTSWYNDTATEFTLTTPQQLAGFAQLVIGGNDFSGKTVKLGADIDISAHLWVPIGTGLRYTNKPFCGTFDGQGYKIKNIYINTTKEYQGFFGAANQATIKNIGIDGGSITGPSYCGGIVGSATNSEIKNCYNTATISSDYEYIGGIAGICDGKEPLQGKIEYCYNTGAIQSGSGIFGGIAGMIEKASVNNCYNTGDISASSTYINDIGGIVGIINGHNGSISNCYNTGTISCSGNTSVGAISGTIGLSNGIINCYYTGYNGAIGQTGSSKAKDDTSVQPFANLAKSSISYKDTTSVTQATNSSAAVDKLGANFSFNGVYTSDDTTKATVEDKTITAAGAGETSINAAITII